MSMTYKREVKTIEEITSTHKLISEYSKRGYSDFERLWGEELLIRTNKPFPKAPVQKGLLELGMDALYFILGGSVEHEKVKPERMSYGEKLVYIDLAHDAAAAAESVLRWKLTCADVPEIRPDSRLEKDLGLSASKEFDLLRAEMKQPYIMPWISRGMRKKTMAEFVEKVAEYFVTLRSY